MNRKEIGYIISEKRKKLGITVSELCEGICSVYELDKIEKGSSFGVGIDSVILLLKRLGYSDSATLEILSAEYPMTSEKLKKACYFCTMGYLIKAEDTVKELSEDVSSLSKTDWPLYRALKAVIAEDKGETDALACLRSLDSAMKELHKGYDESTLPKSMGEEEHFLLYQLALAYKKWGDESAAVKLLYHLYSDLNSMKSLPIETVTFFSLVIAQLEELVLKAGRVDECVELCKKGISLERSNGIIAFTHIHYTNYSPLLIEQGHVDLGEQLAKDAVTLKRVLGM